MLVPQEQARDYFRTQFDGFSPDRDAPALFSLSLQSIDEADVVVAIFDGPDPDSGTAFECGVAWKSGKPIIGVRTDLRGGGDGGKSVNLMLSESCADLVVVNAVADPSLDAVADAIVASVQFIGRK